MQIRAYFVISKPPGTKISLKIAILTKFMLQLFWLCSAVKWALGRKYQAVVFGLDWVISKVLGIIHLKYIDYWAQSMSEISVIFGFSKNWNQTLVTPTDLSITEKGFSYLASQMILLKFFSVINLIDVCSIRNSLIWITCMLPPI